MIRIIVLPYHFLYILLRNVLGIPIISEQDFLDMIGENEDADQSTK